MRKTMTVTLVASSLALYAAAPTSLAASRASRASTGFTLVKTMRGSGARVITTRLPSGPLVFSANHRGQSNFVLELRGPAGRDLLVNEIGSYSGKVVAETRSGTHRVVITADGTWTIQILRPTRTAVRGLPASFAGSGSKVFTVRSSRARELVLTASNRGRSNFIIYLYGYSGLTGGDLLVNEIGPWHGQVIADVEQGYMLLAVQAVGGWSVRFTP